MCTCRTGVFLGITQVNRDTSVYYSLFIRSYYSLIRMDPLLLRALHYYELVAFIDTAITDTSLFLLAPVVT